MLLGAKYGPCMRRDRRLFEGLESSFMREANESGCCVRRDSSGCVQVSSANRCPVSGDHVWYCSAITGLSCRNHLPTLCSLTLSLISTLHCILIGLSVEHHHGN